MTSHHLWCPEDISTREEGAAYLDRAISSLPEDQQELLKAQLEQPYFHQFNWHWSYRTMAEHVNGLLLGDLTLSKREGGKIITTMPAKPEHDNALPSAYDFIWYFEGKRMMYVDHPHLEYQLIDRIGRTMMKVKGINGLVTEMPMNASEKLKLEEARRHFKRLAKQN